jgi:hypothetical protein
VSLKKQSGCCDAFKEFLKKCKFAIWKQSHFWPNATKVCTGALGQHCSNILWKHQACPSNPDTSEAWFTMLDHLPQLYCNQNILAHFVANQEIQHLDQ